MPPIRFTLLFPLLAIIASGLAWRYPNLPNNFQAAIIPLLALVMFSMGMTLTWRDFLAVCKRPGVISVALATQFLVMPLTAFWISRLLGLSSELTTGMILVGASSGGTASNVICYLAKGDLALSILATTASTLVAVIATPALTYFYLHENVPVPFASLLTSIVKIVLAPVFFGTTLNSVFRVQIDKIRSFFPLLSSLAIICIIAIIVAVNRESLSTAAPLVVLAVVLHNLSGLGAGYLTGRMLGYDKRICRTLSIEVGMQNSGLSVALAVKFFGPLTALPGAVFSIWHNLSGSVLAAFWGKDNDRKTGS